MSADVAVAALREIGVQAEVNTPSSWIGYWNSDPRDHHRAANLARAAEGKEPIRFGEWTRQLRRYWHKRLDEAGPAWLDKWECP